MTDIVSRARAVIPPVVHYRNDLVIVRGEGSRVVDSQGREYLDFGTGIAVLNVGHNHPALVAAARDQLDNLWHAGFATYLYESIVAAAERVVSITPAPVEQVMFLNSGAEAVEAAVKLAKKVSQRQGVVVFQGAFHGRTMGSVAYSSSKAEYRQGYHPLLPSVFVSQFPNPRNWDMSQEKADEVAVDHLLRMLKHQVLPSEIAAILIEPVQGEGGYIPGSKGFLGELRRIADEHGILLIFDEVQTGFGRTGEWFASQTIGVEPDILVMGKAIANGLPLSAIGASREVFSTWEPGSHGSTMGGNPVSCAAAVANIDLLGEIIPGVAERSELAFRRFRSMAENHPSVADVRGLGLMIGVELVNPDGHPDRTIFDAVATYALEEGLFILPCGPDANVIRFIPPLNVSVEDLDQGIDILERGIELHT